MGNRTMAMIRQRKNGSYEIRIQNKKLLKGMHFATADSYEQALRYAKSIENQLKAGIIPNELIANEQEYQKKEATLHSIINEYLYKNKNVSNDDRKILLQHQKKIGAMKVSEVTKDFCEEFVQNYKDKRRSETTIKHNAGALSRMLDYMIDEGKINVNPFDRVHIGYTRTDVRAGIAVKDTWRTRRVSEDEEKLILETIDKERKYRDEWRLIFILGIDTASRMSELYRISVKNINLANESIRLLNTKNGSEREIAISDRCIEELQAFLLLKKPEHWLFERWWDETKDIEKVTKNLSRKWAKMMKSAGIKNLHYHDLRHEATCKFYLEPEVCPTDLQVSKQTGHKSINLLQRYTTLRGNEIKRSLFKKGAD